MVAKLTDARQATIMQKKMATRLGVFEVMISCLLPNKSLMRLPQFLWI
jgi:hypothetical protein